VEKTLNPQDGTVHLIDKRKKKAHGIFYMCACGKSSGLIWEKVNRDTPLGCLVCLMREKEKN
jgi:hypothetical protein